MRKAFVGGLAAAAVVALAFIAVETARGQTRDADRLERWTRMFDRPDAVIGATVKDPEKDDLARAKLTQPSGALIQDIDAKGAAAKAGLQRGDIVVEFDGEKIRSARHFSRLVQETPQGRTVKMSVVRNGSRQAVEITPEAGERQLAGGVVPDIPRLSDIEREIQRGLRALPPDLDLDFDFQAGAAMSPRGRLGISVEPLSDQLAEYFGAKEGVLVSSVTPDSSAARAGLKAGDVITSVNGHAVDNPRDLSDRIREVTPGQTLEIGIIRDKKAASFKATMPKRPARRLTQRARPV